MDPWSEDFQIHQRSPVAPPWLLRILGCACMAAMASKFHFPTCILTRGCDVKQKEVSEENFEDTMILGIRYTGRPAHLSFFLHVQKRAPNIRTNFRVLSSQKNSQQEKKNVHHSLEIPLRRKICFIDPSIFSYFLPDLKQPSYLYIHINSKSIQLDD